MDDAERRELLISYITILSDLSCKDLTTFFSLIQSDSSRHTKPILFLKSLLYCVESFDYAKGASSGFMKADDESKKQVLTVLNPAVVGGESTAESAVEALENKMKSLKANTRRFIWFPHPPKKKN